MGLANLFARLWHIFCQKIHFSHLPSLLDVCTALIALSLLGDIPLDIFRHQELFGFEDD